ncbi:MAG: hypothetical protein D3907_04110, partial [Candidatus Electrothrix sp. AUS3]|nr:hypothetical protein [Candidatus Electrothrix gigas]
PFDQRGFAWDIGRDVTTLLAADEFAAGLPIAESDGESTWTGAAREVIKGVIKAVQDKNGKSWSFSDLDKVLSNRSLVIELLKTHYPPALDNFASDDGKDKQTSGVFLNLRRGITNIEYLAKAWQDAPKISLIEWLNDDNHPIRTLILSGSDRYDGLAKFVVSQILNVIYGEILSLPDSRMRKVWTIQDELGDLPKIPKQIKAATKGRSKGLRVVAGIQSIHQLKHNLGEKAGDSLVNAFSIKLGGRVEDSKTAKYLAEQFGTNKMEKVSTSTQDDSGKTSHSLRDDNETALLDSDFLSIPHATLKGGTHFWLRVADWPYCKLHYEVQPTPKRYAPLRPLAWILGEQNTENNDDKSNRTIVFPTNIMRFQDGK